MVFKEANGRIDLAENGRVRRHITGVLSIEMENGIDMSNYCPILWLLLTSHMLQAMIMYTLHLLKWVL